MRRAVQVVEFVLLVSLSAAIGYGIYWAHILGPKAEIAIDQWSAVGLQASSTLNNIRHISLDEKKKYDVQAEAVQGTIRRANRFLDTANKGVADLDRVIQETGTNLNQNVLSQVATTVATTQKAVSDTDAQIVSIGHGATRVLRSANTQVSNPDIPKAVSNLAATTAKFNASAAEILDMLVRLDARLRQMLKPVRFGWHFFLELLGITGSAANISRAIP